MKLVNILALLLMTTTCIPATQKSSDTMSQQNISSTKQQEDKDNLIEFLKQNYHDTKTRQELKSMCIQAERDMQTLSQIKTDIRKPELQSAIQSIDTFLREMRSLLQSLYNFLTKPEINKNDIENFAPQFAEASYLFDKNEQEYNSQKNDAVKLMQNLKLLQRYHQIEQKKQNKDVNLGNWIRNSNRSSDKKAVTNQACKDMLTNSYQQFSEQNKSEY